MSQSDFRLPLAYSWFFLILEPISALIGSYYAYFHPINYLQLTHSASSPSTASSLPLSTSIVLTQLSNLYFLFGINEALVLRSTSDLRVWKIVLLGLLIADFGHLFSVKGLGWGIYWRVWEWNVMAWGNVGFVYVGVAMRVAFLRGWGLDTQRAREMAGRAKMLKEGLRGN